MRYDDKHDRERLGKVLDTTTADETVDRHVVFDFTGLDRANVGDLSLILTARLRSDPTGSVWVRSLPWHTAQVLKYLKLDHLFRHYPEGDGQLN